MATFNALVVALALSASSVSGGPSETTVADPPDERAHPSVDMDEALVPDLSLGTFGGSEAPDEATSLVERPSSRPAAWRKSLAIGGLAAGIVGLVAMPFAIASASVHYILVAAVIALAVPTMYAAYVVGAAVTMARALTQDTDLGPPYAAAVWSGLLGAVLGGVVVTSLALLLGARPP